MFVYTKKTRGPGMGWWLTPSSPYSRMYTTNSLFSDHLHAALFYMERPSPGYLGFGVYLVIYLLSPTHLRAFLFYEKRTYPGCLDFGVYWVIYLLSPASVCAFLFYLELASPGYLDFRVYIINNLFFFLRFTCLPPGIRGWSLLSCLRAVHLRFPFLRGTHPPAI